MKKTKVENISTLKLDFFLKQNKKDIRIVLKPGESSWCDSGSNTKSMILYERKSLIKSIPDSDESIESVKENISSIAAEIVPVQYFYHLLQPMEAPDKKKLVQITTDTPTSIEKAKKETEEYKKESEKTYKGKKRGRKKKRGPKPGSKRKKGGDNTIQ